MDIIPIEMTMEEFFAMLMQQGQSPVMDESTMVIRLAAKLMHTSVLPEKHADAYIALVNDIKKEVKRLETCDCDLCIERRKELDIDFANLRGDNKVVNLRPKP